jgi:hypothetical protein
MAGKGKGKGYSARRKAVQDRLGPSASPAAMPRASGALPIMMGAPGPDARRVFTFATRLHGALQVVEAYFCQPEGLFRLQSTPTQPSEYDPWARQMMAARDEETMALPQRVEVQDALLQRKLWEIGWHASHGRIGAEVDESLAQKLGGKTMRPQHPGRTLPDRGSVLGALEMARAAHRVRSFLHTVPQLELKQKWRERGDSALIKSDSGPTAFGLAVGEWIEQWGLEAIDELLLDSACFYAAIGDHDAARTFRDLATGDDRVARQRRIADFATDLLVAEYS